MNKVRREEGDPLQYHQRIVHDYVLGSNVRGILAYHKMGAGKSILAASICVSLLDEERRHVLVITSKSLHENFRGNIRKYMKMYAEYNKLPLSEVEGLERNFSFISLNASNMLTQLSNAMEGAKSLDGTMVVIDEAHNFFNAIVNGSDSKTELYHRIMIAKNIKLLFLSGSPAINTPFELALCFNMLHGYIHSGSRKYALFGEDYELFMKLFVNNPGATEIDKDNGAVPLIIHADKFADRIAGLVSYYGIGPEIAHLFPKQLDIMVEHVPMSGYQYTLYIGARAKEIDEMKKSSTMRAKSGLSRPHGASSSYRVRSRQFSNIALPPDCITQFRAADASLQYEFHLDKLLPEHLTEAKLREYSPKIHKLMSNIAQHLPVFPEFNVKVARGCGPGIVYSSFVEVGVGLLAKIFDVHGMQRVGDAVKKGSKSGDAVEKGGDGGITPVLRYAVISGDVPTEERDALLQMFNLPENRDGSIIALLLITSTGAEGLDTKRVRHLHILEPHWHWTRLSQVLGRAVRLRSHEDLPETDRNVQPYIYLSDYPPTNVSDELTTDVHLYTGALKNQALLDSFFETLQGGCIDCGDKCRMCAPTNTHLFIPDVVADLVLPSPCEPIREEKVAVKSIKYEGREYMYNIVDTDVGREIHIFEFNEAMGGYVEILGGDSVYFDILAMLQ